MWARELSCLEKKSFTCAIFSSRNPNYSTSGPSADEFLVPAHCTAQHAKGEHWSHTSACSSRGRGRVPAPRGGRGGRRSSHLHHGVHGEHPELQAPAAACVVWAQEYIRTVVIYIPYKYFTGITYWEERSFKNVVCKFQISVTDKLAVRGNAEPSQLSSTCTPPSLTLSKQERGALAACDSSQFLPLLAPCCHRSEHNTQPGASSAAERCDTSSKATIRWLPAGYPAPTSGQTPAGCLTAASRLALHPSHRLLIPKSQGQPARLLVKHI